MNNNIQCSIESSTTKIELNSAVDGVFLVPELEGLVGLPEIRTTSGVNAGYDGGWTSAQNYDARLISIRGVIANPDISKVEDKRRAIASLLGQGRKEQLTLRFTTEAGNAYAISVRTISCEMALQRVLTTQEFLIQLRADDPLIYDDGTTGGIAAILQPQRALGGFEINFGLPLAIGGGAEDTVVDNGNETVYPVIKLYGALHSPTVVNRTTNQQMQILADLQYSIDWHTYRSATGDYILVSDGLNGAPMTLSQLLGNAEQTTYSGKNLFSGDFSQFDNQGGTGSTYAYFKLPTDGVYTLSLKAKNNITASGRYIGFNANGGAVNDGYKWIYQNGAATAGQVFTGTNIYNGVNLGFVFMYPKTSDGLQWLVNNFEIQLESGSTRTDYEPYVGGTPAPNPSYPQPISTVTGDQNIKASGKNLLGGYTYTYDVSGATATYNEDGTLSMAGTCTSLSWSSGTAFVYQRDLMVKLKAGTYTFSVIGNSYTQLVSTNLDGTGERAEATINGGNGSRTFTIATEKLAYARIKVEAGSTDYTCKFMLELGSTATAYEPYQGQSYEVNLGKNLFDKDNSASVLNAYIDNSQSVITANSNDRIIWIACEPNTTYTIQRGWASGGVKLVAYTTSQPAVGVQTYEPKGWNADQTSVTYTTGADARFIVVRIWQFTQDAGHTVDEMLASVQIEKGSRATTYAPYFTPIELAKIGNYQDRIYKNDGKWYIEKQVGKVVFDGSSDESWTFGTTGSLRYPFGIDIVGKGWASSTIDGVMCDTFTLSASSETGIAEQYQFTFRGTSYNNRLWFFCPKSAVTGSTSVEILASYKTFLSTHPTTVYYALATPTTTEITNDTLRAQLNYLASLYEGENNISLMGTGAQGEMAISYATDYTVNQDVITIDSQARTITLNGQDVYHLKTSESEFLVLAPGENKLYLTSEVSDDSGYAEVKFKQGYLSI